MVAIGLLVPWVIGWLVVAAVPWGGSKGSGCLQPDYLNHQVTESQRARAGPARRQEQT
jgi:hypothetical protein